MHIPEPCLCGDPECPRCFPGNHTWPDWEDEDEEAIRHIFRVARGLDSMVLGEPQILGQLKDAFRQAQQAKTLGNNGKYLKDEDMLPEGLDGIACRDETIRHLDKHIDKMKGVIEKDHRDIRMQQNTIRRLSTIKCSDNLGGIHRWNGDGQCLDCCNYATDLIDQALKRD